MLFIFIFTFLLCLVFYPFARSLLGARKKGDDGSAEVVDTEDVFASRPERGRYENLCRREANIVVRSWYQILISIANQKGCDVKISMKDFFIKLLMR